MAKTCKYCGAEMDDNAIQCPECLKKVTNSEIILNKQNKSRKNKITIIVILVLCIIILFIAIIVSSVNKTNKTGGDNFYDPIDMNLSAMVDNNPKKYLNSYPSFLSSIFEEYLGSMADDFEDYLDQMNEEIYKVYGTNISISYNIDNKSAMEEEDIQSYMDDLEIFCEEDLSSYVVQEAYDLSLTITITGTTGTNTISANPVVMKFDGSWYLMTYFNIIGSNVDNRGASYGS